MNKYLIILVLILTASCRDNYTIVAPVSAKADYYIVYSVKGQFSDDKVSSTRTIRVSKEVYESFINSQKGE